MVLMGILGFLSSYYQGFRFWDLGFRVLVGSITGLGFRNDLGF